MGWVMMSERDLNRIEVLAQPVRAPIPDVSTLAGCTNVR